MEFWVSIEDQVFAAKFGDTEFAHFQRGRDGTCGWYREADKLLTEDVFRPVPGEFGHLERIFQDMATGEAVSDLTGPDEIVSQAKRVVIVNDARYWEYEFQIRAVDEGREELCTVQFLVDPDTKLPVQWTRISNDKSKRLSMEIDYPDSGPSSIFDLGVPVDVERVDRSEILQNNS